MVSATSQAAFGISPLEDDLVSVLYGYFDESVSNGVFTMAGWTFKQTKLRKFEHAWGRMLKKHNIEYFHMVECAHGNKQFKERSKQERIDCQTDAIKLICKYTLRGYAVSSDLDMLDKLTMRMTWGEYTNYEWSCWYVLSCIRRYMIDSNWAGQAQYHFEAGHSTQSLANALLTLIGNHQTLSQGYKYKGHGFVKKRDSGAVQAADLLAWQVAKDFKRHKEGKKSRADYTYLKKNSTMHALFAESDNHSIGTWLNALEGKSPQTLFDLLVAEPPKFLSQLRS